MQTGGTGSTINNSSHGRTRPKEKLKGALRHAGLLPLAFRLQEQAAAIVGRGRLSVSEDGLLIPPPALRARVAGTANVEWFLSSGREHAEMIRNVMRSVGAPLEAADRILDFGCGCGRVLRHWKALGSQIHGSDHYAPAVEWCRANLPFGFYSVNELEPPLNFDPDVFDLVYAISVFTHTAESLQRAWLEELARVLRPGGHLMLTTHGNWCARAKLVREEWSRFAEGALVVRDEQGGGSNLCAAFHPANYVRENLSQGLIEAAFRRGSGNGFDQDIWIFRKPA
jgi:SAM-dependent methyltransferase